MDTLYILSERLEHLSARQASITEEINALRNEIARLQRTETKPAASVPEPAPPSMTAVSPQPLPPLLSPQPQPIRKKEKSDLEKFIGENLISKIGIIITVIGVAIGAKYSIDHQLISPAVRIMSGYLFGAGLLGAAFYLRQKYVNFSAVLLSGSMAIMYFITFAAYDFYALIPQAATFVLMFVFTIFTALAAVRYNRQVIAHIGMVGAYAIPFLTGNNSGDALTLFTCISIINLGILALSFVKYWKSLFYASFGLTWLIYAVWYFGVTSVGAYFTIKLVFSSIFFATFYAMFICYKLRQKHKYNAGDIAVLLTDTFIFYAFNYATLAGASEHLLGVFTLLNAAVHFAVGILIYRRKSADRNLFYLVIGLMLLFLTIAIPVQLNGNWITLLWVGEAALLFWIGRVKATPVYENMSFVPLLLAFASLVIDWCKRGMDAPVFLNVWMLGSLFFTVASLFIVYINRKYPVAKKINFIPKIAAIVGLISLYYAFLAEIYFCFSDTYNTLSYNPSDSMLHFRTVWMVCYTLFFTIALSAINFWKIKNSVFSYTLLGLNVLAIFVFLTVGLLELSRHRDFYLQHISDASLFHLGIRYIACLFAVSSLYVIYRQSRRTSLFVAVEIFLYIVVLWMASSELIQWLDIAGIQSYKIGLSILWGVYSLVLIVSGILQKKKHLRIAAIVLFGITLFKLFFYDMAHLDTIAKTIVFVVLGVLLLSISFLYNKFKHQIN